MRRRARSRHPWGMSTVIDQAGSIVRSPERTSLPREPRERRPAAPRAETLVADWLSALLSAEQAILSSAEILGPPDTDRRLHRVRAERIRVAGELDEVVHGQRGATLLVRCLTQPTIDTRLLGLPDGVTACIFDVEGALTASAAVHCDAWCMTLDPFLLAQADRLHREFVPFDPDHDYETYLDGRPRLAALRGFLASRGIRLANGEPSDRPGAESVYGLANRKNELLRHSVEVHGVDAFSGARAYLELARIVGVRAAALSASANTALVLERAGLDDLIEECVDGTVVEASSLRPRPAPDMILAACARLGVDPQQAAAFETTSAGITAARAAGVRAVVALARDEDTTVFSRTNGDRVVNDLGELLERSSRTAP